VPIPPGVFWEEISDTSIKPKKLAAREQPKKKKDKHKKGSGAAAALESSTSDEEEEQEEVLMIKIPWMQAYLAYIINKRNTRRPSRGSQSHQAI
jgi:cytochrome bd-type quinol oxidase subunit 1